MQFKSTLVMALNQRANCSLTSLCLVNGQSDGLADLVIHEYSQHCFVQTASLERDKQIPEIIEILTSHRKPKSIWLKNQTELRQKRALPLSDQLLWGVDVRQIVIQEDLLSYTYSTDSPHLWPLHERFLRANLAQWQLQNSSQQFLVVGPKTSFDLHALFKNVVGVPVLAPHWAEVCEALRKQANTALFPLGILCLPSLIATDKNKKALFHVLHQFLKLLDANAEVWLSFFSSDSWLLGLLQKAAATQKKNLVLLQQSVGEQDFPLPLGQKNIFLKTYYQIKLC